MFAKTADTITKKLQENNSISSEQYEICRFGFQQGLTILLNAVKFSTTTGDFKTVYVCEWNSSGTAKSYLNDQHEYNQDGDEIRPANKFANINASFFTPTHTYHEGYTTQADSYLCYWLN